MTLKNKSEYINFNSSFSISYFERYGNSKSDFSEGSVPEMRIWSILLIKSDLKWCIHLGKVSFCILRTFVEWILSKDQT